MATILVVDDRAINRDLLVTLLGYSGHRLLEARDGAEAMDIVRRDKPDLIITDLLMPNMNGFEFVRAIREDVALADAKVIFHTATFHPNEAILLGDACGVTMVLPKPATPVAILEAVRQALNLPLVSESETPITLLAAAPAPQGKAALARFGERTTECTAQAHEARCELDQLLAEHLPQAHQEMKALTARLTQSEMALQRSALRLRGLVQLSLDQPIERDVNRILERFCLGVVGITDVQHLLVCLLDEKSLEAACYLHTGESAETVRIDPISSVARAHALELAAADPQRAVGASAAALCAGLYPSRVTVKSCIVVPVATATKRYGMMSFANSLSDQRFSDEDQDVAIVLADQLAVLLENADLYGLVQRHAATLQLEVAKRTAAETKAQRLNRVYAVLSAINAAIVRIRDRQELFEEACSVAVREGGFRMAWIGLVDYSTKRVDPIASAGHEDGFLRNVARLSLCAGEPDADPMLGRAVRMKTAVIVNDVAADPDIGNRAAHLRRGYRSIAMLPLIVGEQVVGVFTLCAADAGTFDEAELQLLSELAGDISFALGYFEKEQRVHYLAYYDPLSGLANRSLLEDRLRQALHMAERYQLTVGVLFIDLDRFKLVNDSLGHSAGDEVLKVTASRLRACARDIDTVARVGGDEFVVVLAGLEQHGTSALEVAQRILATFSTPIISQERELFVSCSIGVALYPRDGDNEETLLRNADAAMYQAKQLGRNNCHVYTVETSSKGCERLTLETALRHALARDELRLHYQPLIDLESGRVTGLEALIRWQRSPTELVSPGLFIPLAEESGLIYPISQWVLETACAQNKAWQDEGLPPVHVAVNLSAHQFRQGDLARQIETVLSDTGLQAKYLEVELTESILMENIDAAIGVMTQLREHGVCISLDDFGTGYSSLSYLRRFPIDTLKIDQSFVREITSDPGSAAIAYAIIAMAHSLRLPVLAEGVETAGQLALLRAKGCNMMQGYLFSKPLPPNELAQLLREGCCLPSSPLRGDGPALLLVDEEPNVLSALKRALRGQNYRVFTASTATEAFELMAQNTIHVVVADRRVPQLNGTEFFGRVKDLYPQTMRIMLSGYTEPRAMTDAINQGAVYKFLTKPWDDQQLQATIKEAFQRFAAHQPPSGREAETEAFQLARGMRDRRDLAPKTAKLEAKAIGTPFLTREDRR